MGCSEPKLSRTGLRNILAFLKVELQHFLGGTQALLRSAVRRGLTDPVCRGEYFAQAECAVVAASEGCQHAYAYRCLDGSA